MGKYDDGKWHASTMGHFIGLLVDAGPDPAVVFRIVNDDRRDDSGTFIRWLEVAQIPNGFVETVIRETGADVHKTLTALMEGLVVK